MSINNQDFNLLNKQEATFYGLRRLVLDINEKNLMSDMIEVILETIYLSTYRKIENSDFKINFDKCIP